MKRNTISRMMKKMAALGLAGVMVLGMTACGGSADSGDADESSAEGTEAESEAGIGAGTYTYEQTVLNADEMEAVPYNFGYGTLKGMTRSLKVELTLEEDETYSMSVRAWMQEDTEGSTKAVGDDFEFGETMYAEWLASSAGTYTVTEDQTIVITAEEGTYEVPDFGSSYMAQIFGGGNAASGSYNAEGENYYGEWTSADVPAILDQFPDTEFFVEGDVITGWVRSDYVAVGESADAVLYFYADGTATVRDTANKVDTNLTWSAETGSVVVSYTQTLSMEEMAAGATPEVSEFTVGEDGSVEVSFGEYSYSFTLTEEGIASLTA